MDKLIFKLSKGIINFLICDIDKSRAMPLSNFTIEYHPDLISMAIHKVSEKNVKHNG
tara:strand:+ start:389 stop:559 length:171 start_codon:yes stop_codon:yes gene_type:complete